MATTKQIIAKAVAAAAAQDEVEERQAKKQALSAELALVSAALDEKKALRDALMAELKTLINE